MELPEQDFYEQFFFDKYGDEGLNLKFSSGLVDLDVQTSRTEETVDISAGLKQPLKYGSFECGMTSQGGINLGVSQNLLEVFDLKNFDALNSTANLMITQDKQQRFCNYGFNTFADLAIGKSSFRIQAIKIPDDEDDKQSDSQFELSTQYNLNETTKLAAKTSIHSVMQKQFSGQIQAYTKLSEQLGVGAKFQSDFSSSNLIELYSSFHSELNNFIIGGKFLYNFKDKSCQNYVAFQKAFDESTSFSIRTEGISGDTDAVIETKIASNVDLRVCFGFDLKELSSATCHKKDYNSPYLGLNFDIRF